MASDPSEGRNTNGSAIPPLFTPAYRRYVLGLLVVVYIFNFIDRQILAILLEPIKRDLGLSDARLGFLGGVAFALFYTTLGLPIARWADRANRRTIIALAVAVWSGMTALCGLAQNFWQLALARVGVGIGEAGGSPPAHSLISDYFPPESRATALAIYSLGVPIGVLFGFLIGGWANEWLGWRATFLLVGLPGLVVALLVRLTIQEPPRGYSEGISAGAAPPIGGVFRVLWQRRSFRWLALGAGMNAFFGYGIMTWLAAFLMRSHDLGTGETGTWLALIYGLAGGLGTFLAGPLADRLGQHDLRWYMWVPALSMLGTFPFAVGLYLAPTAALALAFAVLPIFLNTMYLGPTFATVQGLAEPRMRAMAAALLLFILNLIGLTFGPWSVGLLSDFLAPTLGRESLRYALLMASLANIVGALFFFLASHSLRADMHRRIPSPED